MINIIVPASLSDCFGGKDNTDCDGKSVEECIDILASEYPVFKERVLRGKNEVSASVLMFVNGENIYNLEGIKTPVNDGDEISIIPFAAGG